MWCCKSRMLGPTLRVLTAPMLRIMLLIPIEILKPMMRALALLVLLPLLLMTKYERVGSTGLRTILRVKGSTTLR